MVDEQGDVGELRRLPGVEADRLEVELGPHSGDAFGDPLVVELDPLPHGRLGRDPGRRLEVLLGVRARRAEQPVVPVEALDQHRCNRARPLTVGGTDGRTNRAERCARLPRLVQIRMVRRQALHAHGHTVGE